LETAVSPSASSQVDAHPSEAQSDSLPKRARGAQMVDTGPGLQGAPVANLEAPSAESVRETFANLQAGVERGRAAGTETSEPTGPVADELVASLADDMVSAVAEEAIVESNVDASPARGGLRKRVKGAQFPTETIAPVAAARPADADAVRSAFSSLQRGVNAARQEVPEADLPDLADLASDSSTHGASAPTH
jgi:hypothetical protein